MELLFLFMDRSTLVSANLGYGDNNISKMILFHFDFGFCMEETAYIWHLIFTVPSVCWFSCCEQIHSNVWGGNHYQNLF